MANNPYVNKVVYGSNTIIDLTDATATADKILEGYTAYGASGEKLIGTATTGDSIVISDTIDEHGGTIRSISGIDHAVRLQAKIVTPTTSRQVINPDTGYDGLRQVVVEAEESADLQSKTVSYIPSETAQSENITADSGYDGLSSVRVSVGAIPSSYGRIEWDGATLMVY